MSELTFENVRKSFGRTDALVDFTLDVEQGESIVLLGPSGCGKTTTLRMVAGFERPTSGRISIAGQTVADDDTFVAPEERDVGVVFQSYALWPHMTVEDNIGFGLTVRRRRKQFKGRQAALIAQALERVQLPGFERRYPHELSGGQQQRIALARALVTSPKILLLDEPLSNLDTRLREDMRFQIRQLQQDLGITMIYITHDRSEALALADRVVALHLGRCQQVAPPTEMYRLPRTRFVALSMGAANFVDGTMLPDQAAPLARLSSGHTVELRHEPGRAPQPGAPLTVCIRPSDIGLLPADEAAVGEVIGTVRSAIFLGDEVHYEVELPGTSELWRVVGRGSVLIPTGERVAVSIAPRSASPLDPGPDHQPVGSSSSAQDPAEPVTTTGG